MQIILLGRHSSASISTRIRGATNPRTPTIEDAGRMPRHAFRCAGPLDPIVHVRHVQPRANDVRQHRPREGTLDIPDCLRGGVRVPLPTFSPRSSLAVGPCPSS